MADEKQARFSDQEIITQLGSAVLLCWDELPAKAQLQILDQANDMMGITPIPDIRSRIVELLIRRTRDKAIACSGSPFSPQSGCGIPRAISRGGG